MTSNLCHQKEKVNQADAGMLARNPLCGLPQVLNINGTKAYQRVFGSGTIQIVRGGACDELRNPLIVAEGLDTGLLAQGGTIGDSDINTFFRSIVSIHPSLVLYGFCPEFIDWS